LEIVQPRARALVGVDDRAAVLEPPLARGPDRSVGTARSRRDGTDPSASTFGP
jgi:hypothetical protein